MKIQKDIAFFDEKLQISVVYTNGNFRAGDQRLQYTVNVKSAYLLPME